LSLIDCGCSERVGTKGVMVRVQSRMIAVSARHTERKWSAGDDYRYARWSSSQSVIFGSVASITGQVDLVAQNAGSVRTAITRVYTKSRDFTSFNAVEAMFSQRWPWSRWYWYKALCFQENLAKPRQKN